MRLYEFAADGISQPPAIPQEDLLRLTALSELLAGQSEQAGENPSISMKSFLQHAKNLGVENLSPRSFVNASTQEPLSNVIKNIEDDEIYFSNAEEEVKGDTGEVAAGDVVSKMADRQAKQAFK